MSAALPRHHSEFAPLAIERLFSDLSSALPFIVNLGGILGDEAHTKGYHRARAVLPPDDYSVQLPRDRGGRPWAASAIDITPAASMHVITLTSRLRAAVDRADPRLGPVREFYGTLDGRHVYGYDLAVDDEVTSDSSHLWHLHLSIYRDSASRPSLLRPLARILAGR